MRYPTGTHYVEDTRNYVSRAIVAADAGGTWLIDDKGPNASLRSAIVTTLLIPNDRRTVDLFTDNAIKLSSDMVSDRYGLVTDQRSKPIGASA